MQDVDDRSEKASPRSLTQEIPPVNGLGCGLSTTYAYQIERISPEYGVVRD